MGRHVDKIKMSKLLNGVPEVVQAEIAPIEENELILQLVEKVANLEKIVETLGEQASKQTKNNKKEDKKESKKEDKKEDKAE